MLLFALLRNFGLPNRMDRLISDIQQQETEALIKGAQRVVVTAHQGPDGDAVGSAAAMALLLRRLGKEVDVVLPNAMPDNLLWIPTAKEMILFSTSEQQAKEALAAADLIVCLDYGEAKRVGENMQSAMAGCTAPRLVVDHHMHPEEGFGTVLISRPDMSSTCELLLRMEQDLDLADGMSVDEAEALYTGIMTDTGNFAWASSRAEVFDAVAWLMRKGADRDHCSRQVFWTCTEGRFRLMGFLLYVKMERIHELNTCIMTLTRKEYRHFNVKNGDTEGFVSIPLQIEGMRLSIFLREDTEHVGRVRVSTRSVDDFPCNRLAEEFFNGGGHLNAAGGQLECSLDEAVEIAKRAIRKYEPLLKTKTEK